MSKIRSLDVLLIVIAISMVSGQLIGSRGVSNVVDGEEYRDQKTLQDTKNVAKFEKIFQPLTKHLK